MLRAALAGFCASLVCAGAAAQTAVSVRAESAEVSEGQSGAFVFALSASSSGATLAFYRVAASSTATAADYGGQLASVGVVEFQAGVSSVRLAFDALNDGVIDDGETLVVELAGVPGGATPGMPSMATVTIRDHARSVTLTGPPRIPEGGTARYALGLAGWTAPAGGLELQYRIMGAVGSGHTAAVDFTHPLSGSVHIAAGGAAGSFNVVAAADDLAEGIERFVVEIVGARVAGRAPQQEVATGQRVVTEIADLFELSLSGPSGPVAEGETARFVIRIAGGALSQRLFLGFRTSLPPGEGDLLRPPGTARGGRELTELPAGQREVLLDYSVLDEGEVEDEERFAVELLSFAGAPQLPGELRLRAGALRAEVVIPANGGVQALLSGRSPAEVTEESGEQIVFSVQIRGEALMGGVSLHFRTRGNATVGTDYEVQTGGGVSFDVAMERGTLVLAAGARAGEIAVQVLDDSEFEPRELISLELTGADAALSGETVAVDARRLRAAILPSDTIYAEVRARHAEIDEGAMAVFNIALSRAVHTSPLRVDYAVSGSAKAGTDYTASSGTHNIAVGDNNFVLRIPTADDAAAEAAETIVVTLSALSGGGISGPLSVSSEPAQVTLRASDQVWAVTRAVAAEVSETGSGGVASDAAFDICLEGGMPGVGEMLSVRFRLSGSAALRQTGSADPYDYETVMGGAALNSDGSFTTQAFTALGCQRISHAINDDNLNEGAETIVLTLAEISGAASLPLAVSSTAAQVTIAASDETQVSVASLDSAPLAEGAAARFAVSYRGGVPTAPVMLNYAIEGDVESSDYTDSNSGAVTFAADAAESARRIEIATEDDSAAEPPETLTLTLSSVSGGGGGGIEIETASASAVIAPNDGALHAAPRALHGRVVEGFGVPGLVNVAQFQICLSGAALETGRTASVRFRLSGSARNFDDTRVNPDYSPQPAAGVSRDSDTGEYTLGFSDKPDAGEACSATLSYSIRSDRLSEGEETIELTLTQLSGGNADSTLSFDSTPARVTIVGDGPLPLSLLGPAAAVAEGGTAVWTLALRGDLPSADILLPFSLSGVAAADVNIPLHGVRRITVAEAAAARHRDNPVPLTIAVGIVADGVTEDAETLVLTLDNSPERGPSGGGSGIFFNTLRSASVRIPANDGVRAELRAAAAEVAEGGTARFAVRLVGEVHSANLLLDFALSGDATQGSDYSLPQQLQLRQQILAPGARSSSIAISITDDAEMEGAESLIVRLTQLAGMAADGPFSVDMTPAEVTILGNDGIYASLRVLQADVTEPGDSPPAGGVPAAAVFAFCLEGDEPHAPVTVSFDGNPGSAQLWTPAFPAFSDYRKRGSTASSVELEEIGCTSVTFEVLEDLRSEPAEEIRLRITGISGAGAGAPLSFSTDTAAATIRASDAVELALRGPAMQVQEGADAVFEIVLSGGFPTSDIAVPLLLSGIDAADLSSASLLATRDITPVQAVAARRTISPEPITIAIGIADDALLESAETLIVALDDRMDRRPTGGGGGGVLIAPGEGQARAVIAGSDGIRAEVRAAQQQVAEGGEAVFRISLVGEVHTAALFVDYRVGGSARAGVDHTGLASGTLRIPMTETGGELRFAITDDSRTESAESIVVTLSALRGGGVGGALSVSDTAARTTILGSDGLFASVLVARSEVVESDEAGFNAFSSAVFRICIEGEAPGAPVQVQYSVAGTAQPYRPGGSLDPTQPRPPGSMLPFADYYLVSGSENVVVTLPGLGCSREIEFGIYGDSLNEGAEIIGFGLVAIAGGNCDMVGCTVSLEGVTVSIRASDPISASVSGPATARNESGSAVFRVTLSGGTPSANVEIPYSIGGAGIGSGDYTDAGNGRLVITPAQAAAASVTPLAITIAIDEDSAIEVQETLRLSLGTPSSAGEVTVSPAVVSVAIADSDSASATLSGGGSVPEGGAGAAFTLALRNGGAQRSTDVPVRILYTLSGTAQQGADYTLQAGPGLSLTQAAQMGGDLLPAIALEAGSSGGELRIEPVADDNNEPGETVMLQLGRVLDGSGADFTRITVGAAVTATIADDDEVTATLSGGGAVNEGGSAVFRVTLSGGKHSAELVVPFGIGATADATDTDAQAADYQADASPLRIPQGTRSAEIRVRIIADGVMEPAESFALSLGALSGGGGGSLRSAGSPRTATIAASAQTDRSVSLSGPAQIAEGASGRYEVSIGGSAPTADVEVSWEVSRNGANSAEAADFSGGVLPSGGPLTFTPANFATAQNFEVTAAADMLLEGPQSFTIALSVATTSAGVTSGDGVSLHAAIADGNTARVSLARSDADGFGEAGSDGSAARSAVFTASVSGAQLTAAAQLDFSVFGCGGGADCTFSPASPLVIAQGSSTASITVTAVNDGLNEAAESIRVTLSDARSAGRLELDSASATASLSDDDAILAAIADESLDADADTSGVQVNEGGEAVFRVTLGGAAAGSAAAVMVPYTVGGGGVGVTPQDFRDITASRSSSTPGGGTLLIPAVTTSGVITLEIVQDGLAEGAEILQVTLGAAISTGAGGGAIALGTPQSASLSIPQNASTERSFSVTAVHSSRSEGQTAEFRIALTGSAPMGAATVDWALSGVSAGDYSAPSAARGTLQFTSTGSQSVRVAIRADGLNEAAETLKLTLSNAAGGGVGGASIGRAEAATVIAASDPLTYAIGADYSVNEGDSGSTEVSFTVSLSGASASAGGPLAVPFVLLAEGTAEEASDYTLSASPLLIRGTMAELRIFVLGDALFEADETVIIELGAASTGPGGGALIAGRRRATLTIANDDASPFSRRLSALTMSIARADDDGFAEGGAAGAGTARFRVSLSGAPQQPVSALFSVDGQWIDAGDYEIAAPPVSGAVSRITIAPPATSAEIVIRALDDRLNEGAETLRVTLSTPVSGGGQAVVLGTAEASATLAASDGVSLRLTRDNAHNLNEGEAAGVWVEMDFVSAGDVSVEWQAAVVSQTNTEDSGPRARNGPDAPEFRAENGGLRADGLGVRGVLRIPAGARRAVFHIIPARDEREEDAEMIRVVLGAVNVGQGGGVMAVGEAVELRVNANTAGESTGEAERRARRVTTLLAALDRGAAGLANGAIRARMARHRTPMHTTPPWLRIAGHAWRANAAPSAESADSGARDSAASRLGLALYGAAGRGGGVEGGGVNFVNLRTPGAAGAVGAAGDSGASVLAARAGPFRGLGAGLAGDANFGRRTAGPGRAGWLRGSGMEFGSAARSDSQTGMGALRVWASGDLAESRFDAGSGGLAWKASSSAAHMGVETQLLGGALLAGAALGAADGSLDFTERTAGAELRGTAESLLLSLHPYLGWQLSPGVHAWFTLGYGRGDFRISESRPAAAAVQARSDSSLWTTAAGVSGEMRLRQRFDLALSLETMQTRSRSQAARFADGALLPAVSAGSTRISGEFEVAVNFAPGGISLRPFASLRTRRDSGDASATQSAAGAAPGGTRTATDGGGGLALNWPSQGLSMDLRGMTQLLEGGVGRGSERSFSLSASWDPGVLRRGLSLALQSGGEPGLMGEVAYGISLRPVFAPVGVLLTPYSRMEFGAAERRWSAGLRLHPNVPARGARESLHFGLEGGVLRRNGAEERDLRLRAGLRF